MKYFGEGLSEKHKELSRIIRKPSMLEQAAQLFLEIHASLHLSRISGTQPNEVDALLSDLTDSEYAVMPSGRDETIAWVLWHIARIEDLTMGILAAKGNQLFNEEWQKRLNVSITDTGNAESYPGCGNCWGFWKAPARYSRPARAAPIPCPHSRRRNCQSADKS